MPEHTPQIRVGSLSSGTHDLYAEDGWLKKGLQRPGTNQTQPTGRRPHIVDFDGADFLFERSPYHARCLTAKGRFVSSYGFRDSTISKVLSPLCDDDQLQPLLDFVARTLGEHHDAAIEVVYTDGVPTGLHPLHPRDYWVYREEGRRDYHYEIRSKAGFTNTEDVHGLRFACFGDREDMIRRLGIDIEDQDKVSEVIRFVRDRNVLSEDYGTAEWWSAVPYMELESCQVQYSFDFFYNGCMPDGIYTVSKGLLGEDAWKELKETLQQHQGPGKRRKIMCVNIGGEEIEVQFDKLDAEKQGTSDAEEQSLANALAVVTAHGVPPLIAGIMVPGKMGGNNEFPNALQAFHAQYAGPVQIYISQVLAATLGRSALPVTPEMFLGETADEMEPDPTDPTGMKMRKKDLRGNGFWTILDTIDIQKADTISRMKQPLPEAQAEGRDLKAGAATRGSDKQAGRGDNN